MNKNKVKCHICGTEVDIDSAIECSLIDTGETVYECHNCDLSAYLKEMESRDNNGMD